VATGRHLAIMKVNTGDPPMASVGLAAATHSQRATAVR
jgi:hypothetical protein